MSDAGHRFPPPEDGYERIHLDTDPSRGGPGPHDDGPIDSSPPPDFWDEPPDTPAYDARQPPPKPHSDPDFNEIIQGSERTGGHGDGDPHEHQTSERPHVSRRRFPFRGPFPRIQYVQKEWIKRLPIPLRWPLRVAHWCFWWLIFWSGTALAGIVATWYIACNKPRGNDRPVWVQRGGDISKEDNLALQGEEKVKGLLDREGATLAGKLGTGSKAAVLTPGQLWKRSGLLIAVDDIKVHLTKDGKVYATAFVAAVLGSSTTDVGESVRPGDEIIVASSIRVATDGKEWRPADQGETTGAILGGTSNPLLREDNDGAFGSGPGEPRWAGAVIHGQNVVRGFNGRNAVIPHLSGGVVPVANEDGSKGLVDPKGNPNRASQVLWEELARNPDGTIDEDRVPGPKDSVYGGKQYVFQTDRSPEGRTRALDTVVNEDYRGVRREGLVDNGITLASAAPTAAEPDGTLFASRQENGEWAIRTAYSPTADTVADARIPIPGSPTVPGTVVGTSPVKSSARNAPEGMSLG